MAPDTNCDGCEEAPHALLVEGIALFNARDYFACHEVLEDVWNAERRPVRTVYKGILQVGVGCYHLLRNNYIGATAKLRSGADYLDPFAPTCFGVDLARLIADARALLTEVERVGPEHLQTIDLARLPRIERLASN